MSFPIVKMPKSLTLPVKTFPSFWMLVLTTILATGLVSILCQSSKVNAGLPKVQVHLRHLQILTKLQQDTSEQGGLVNSVPPIKKVDSRDYAESNFSKISARATKEVVLRHGITKPERRRHPSSLRNLVGRALILSQSPQIHSHQVKANHCSVNTPRNRNYLKLRLRANIPANCTTNTSFLD